MPRIGEVQLYEYVLQLRELSGLDLTLRGYPVPPHQVYIGDVAVTEPGTPTRVHHDLGLWYDGYAYHNRKIAAQLLAKSLGYDGGVRTPPS
jgi:hypothetical protein